MSKTIYYIELQREGQAPSKFKFAIDGAKKMVKQVRQQLKGKLLQKKAVEDTHDLVLRDSQLFELCSDDQIDDVVPEPQKNIVVTVKGQGKNPPSSVISQPPSISSIPGSVVGFSSAPQSISASVVQAPNIFAPAPVVVSKIKELRLNPLNKVEAYKQENPDTSHIQLKFVCPQLFNHQTPYGLVTPKKQTFYELSNQICKLFNFEGQPNLKAVLYYQNGQPMLWSMDYMSLLLPEIDSKQTYTVIFTKVTTTSESPVQPLGNFEEKCQIFVKSISPIGVKVDLDKTTVGDLQVLIYNNMRIHPTNQFIKFGIKTLNDPSLTLSTYDIKQNSMLQVSFKVRHRINALTYCDNFYSQQIQTIFPQSVGAKRTFRSTMLILCKRLPTKIQVKLLALIRQISRNSALVASLASLFNNINITQTQKIALEEGMFILFRDFLLQAKDFPTDYAPEQIFKLARQCLGYFVDRASKLKDLDEYQQLERFVELAQVCEITLAVIEDPVYIKLDDNSKVITNRPTVLNFIKNKTNFRGIASLSEGNIIQDKDIKQLYGIFKINSTLNQTRDVRLYAWAPKIEGIGYLVDEVRNYQLKDKFNHFADSMQKANVQLKVYNPLQLKNKTDYIYLLVDKSNQQKIYVGKNKDIHTPHSVFDVITGSQTAVNFDIMGGVAGSQSVEKVVSCVDIKPIITKDPAEAIVVLLDISGSMGGKFFNQPDLKRIGAVKSFFEAFAYRTMAYNFQHVISLILFDDKVDEKVDFTESFHDFNLLVANANPRGSTLLFDAMVVATQKLLNFKKKYPNCILRILALTDGQDTGSRSSIVDTTQLLLDSNILVDSFVVGSNCEGLKCITFGAGGKCYLTRDIQQSLKLFEQQTVLSARTRKTEQKVKCQSVADLVEKMKLRPFDMPNNVHAFKLPEISKPAVDAKNLADQLSKDPTKLNSIAPTANLKRIVKELTNYQASPHPFVAVFPCEDISLWKILLLGPHKTPYEGGLFELYVRFPTEYPFKAPEVRFVTPIYHCNMNSQGRICHSVFDRNYSPAITFKTIVDSVYGLILTPEPEDPLDNVIATYFLSNYQQYYQNAVKATKTNASKSIEQIVESLFGKIADDIERQKKIQQITEWKKQAEASN